MLKSARHAPKQLHMDRAYVDEAVIFTLPFSTRYELYSLLVSSDYTVNNNTDNNIIFTPRAKT